MRPCLESLLDGDQRPDRIVLTLPDALLRKPDGYDIPGGQGCDGFALWTPWLAGAQAFFDRHVAGTRFVFHDDLWISFFLALNHVHISALPAPEGCGYDQVHQVGALSRLGGPPRGAADRAPPRPFRRAPRRRAPNPVPPASAPPFPGNQPALVRCSR